MTDLSDRFAVQFGALADDLREVFAELDRSRGAAGPPGGEYEPDVDVLESDTAVDVLVNVPGVRADLIRVLVRPGVILIAGDKRPDAAPTGAAFHLAERRYGRFVRVVRLSHAYDTAGATARLHQGELRIVVPKLSERRGHAVPIQVAVD